MNLLISALKHALSDLAKAKWLASARVLEKVKRARRAGRGDHRASEQAGRVARGAERTDE